MSSSKTLNQYISEAQKATEKQRKDILNALEGSAKSRIDQTTNEYNNAIDDTKVAYESEYERNAVQKLINERNIAERNANLGLTDSGLNRTQQTAVQLSYANQKNNINIARQNAIDTLTNNLASAISAINQTLDANKVSVNQMYDQLNLQTANELRNADISNEQFNRQLDANQRQFELQMKQNNDQFEKQLIENKRQFDLGYNFQKEEAAQQNQALQREYELKKQSMLNEQELQKKQLLLQEQELLSEQDARKKQLLLQEQALIQEELNKINNSNKSNTAVAQKNVNKNLIETPYYSGKINSDANIYGTFSNGYQPKGISGHGALKSTGNKINVEKVGLDGVKKIAEQNIWQAEDGTYWYWNGNKNKYILFNFNVDNSKKSSNKSDAKSTKTNNSKVSNNSVPWYKSNSGKGSWV